MTQGDVALVLEALRQFEEEEFEVIGSTWHEDGVVTAPEGWPEPGPFEGSDAVEGQFRRLASGLGRHHFRDVDVVADRDGWVVVSFLWDVRGEGSGAAFSSKISGAYHVVEGRFRRRTSAGLPR